MSAVEAVLARLKGDAAVAAALTGGVYRGDLKRQGPNATPDAYAPTEPHQARPAAVVVDDGEVDALLGPPTSQAGTVSVWFYAPRTALGRESIAAGVEATRRSLYGFQWPTQNGTTPARIEGPGLRLGTRDDPVDDARLVDRVAFPYAAVWRLD